MCLLSSAYPDHPVLVWGYVPGTSVLCICVYSIFLERYVFPLGLAHHVMPGRRQRCFLHPHTLHGLLTALTGGVATSSSPAVGEAGVVRASPATGCGGRRRRPICASPPRRRPTALLQRPPNLCFASFGWLNLRRPGRSRSRVLPGNIDVASNMLMQPLWINK